MLRHLRGFASMGVSLLACTLLAGAAPLAEAAWLGYRNDLKAPVVIQGASIINNVLRRGKPRVLHPGEVAWDTILTPGNKLITVYDAKQPTRVLYQGTVQFRDEDLFFAVQPDPKGPPPKALLVPSRPPKDGPGKPPGPQPPPDSGR
jgi:hypothetical protein